MTLNGLEGIWEFRRPWTGGMQQGVAEAHCRDGRLVISVTSDGVAIMDISVLERGDVLIGSAKLKGSEAALDVKFEIRNGGRSLLASPSGFRNLEAWHFVRRGDRLRR